GNGLIYGLGSLMPYFAILYPRSLREIPRRRAASACAPWVDFKVLRMSAFSASARKLRRSLTSGRTSDRDVDFPPTNPPGSCKRSELNGTGKLSALSSLPLERI